MKLRFSLILSATIAALAATPAIAEPGRLSAPLSIELPSAPTQSQQLIQLADGGNWARSGRSGRSGSVRSTRSGSARGVRNSFSRSQRSESARIESLQSVREYQGQEVRSGNYTDSSSLSDNRDQNASTPQERQDYAIQARDERIEAERHLEEDSKTPSAPTATYGASPSAARATTIAGGGSAATIGPGQTSASENEEDPPRAEAFDPIQRAGGGSEATIGPGQSFITEIPVE